MKHINFKQPKYILPAILYFPILGTGYAVGSIFTSEVKEIQDPNLKTTEYLNSDLPDAVINDEIGSKRKNLQDVFGNIKDHSGIDNIDDDRDSIRKKEEYDSRYSEEEIKQIEFQKAQEEQIKRLQEENRKLQEAANKKSSTASSSSSSRSSSGGSRMGEDDFPLSAADRERINQLRRSGKMSDMERDLTDGKGFGSGASRQGVTSSEGGDKVSDEANIPVVGAENTEEKSVFKKVTVMNKKFNTLASNDQESTLIKAIVDEEIKVVDGSRVRLRILDDIIIDGVTVKKGSYLYATMSGFSKQRIKGTVNSIMVDDEIHKIHLNVYDTDGLEGLYVPESSFRSTAQDVASSAINTNMNMNNGGYGGDNVRQWAQQGLQQSYQRVTSAISKAIKKNKVRIKYGTHIYLVNANNKKQKK